MLNYDEMMRVKEKHIIYSVSPTKRKEYTEQVDKAFTKFAGIYNIIFSYLPIWVKWLKNVLPYIEGVRVLETSFGGGSLMINYAKKYETCGVEYNSQMIRYTRKKLNKNNISSNLVKADIIELPFCDGYFDTVINTMSFTGYPDGFSAMNELSRVLNKNGSLLIINFDFPRNRNPIGCLIIKILSVVGNMINNVSNILEECGLDYSEYEIGAFGTVHLYIAKKG